MRSMLSTRRWGARSGLALRSRGVIVRGHEEAGRMRGVIEGEERLPSPGLWVRYAVMNWCCCSGVG